MRGERRRGLGEPVAPAAEIVGVGRIDRVARQTQPALDTAEQLTPRQREALRGGERVHLGEQRGKIARFGGAHGVGQPVPQGHGVALDQAGQRFGGPYGGYARFGEPQGDGHLALGPFPELRVVCRVPADLDHQVAEAEHRVLAEREELRAGGQSGGRQYLARTHVVHGSIFSSAQATLTNGRPVSTMTGAARAAIRG